MLISISIRERKRRSVSEGGQARGDSGQAAHCLGEEIFRGQAAGQCGACGKSCVSRLSSAGESGTRQAAGCLRGKRDGATED